MLITEGGGYGDGRYRRTEGGKTANILTRLFTKEIIMHIDLIISVYRRHGIELPLLLNSHTSSKFVLACCGNPGFADCADAILGYGHILYHSYMGSIAC